MKKRGCENKFLVQLLLYWNFFASFVLVLVCSDLGEIILYIKLQKIKKFLCARGRIFTPFSRWYCSSRVLLKRLILVSLKIDLLNVLLSLSKYILLEWWVNIVEQ